MSRKLELSQFESRYGIRPQEIAFLVREYLKEQECNQTVTAFIQEYPQATRSQAPPNKKTLSLSHVVNKYCEMRNRGDTMEKTLKELRKTKKQLLSTLFQLERDQQAQSHTATSTIRIPKPSHSGQVRTTHQDTPNDEVASLSSLSEASVPTSQKPEEDTTDVQSIASAVVQNAAKLMEQHPNLSTSLVDQLNDILSRRRRNESDSRDTRDAVYDQVMGSYAVERLINNLIPHNAVEATVMSPLPENSTHSPSRSRSKAYHQPHHTGSNRENGTSKSSPHPRKKASRSSGSSSSSSAAESTLLTAGMRHPSIQVTSVRSPGTPQMLTPQSSVPSTPLSPNQATSRVGNKRRQPTSPERPETPGSSTIKKRIERELP